ncbi:MAG: hypothetical protein EOO15_22630 [Chitinophagaceae bacterium]|nr:MAG: hypothetical protein EOO15_22630 [Chitinophagaceae bacterium]
MRLGFLFLFLIIGSLFNVAGAQLKSDTTIVVKWKVMTTASKARGMKPSRNAPRKDRGVAATVTFDNWTSDSIWVFVDGIDKGILLPWGKASFSVSGNYFRIYCYGLRTKREWSDEGTLCASNMTFKLQ